MDQPRAPKMWEALLPVVAMMVFIIVGLLLWELEPHIPIVLASIVAALVATRLGYSWQAIVSGILDSIGRATEALIIVMIVGMLIGSWVLSGTMPAMVYHGLSLLTPGMFLPIGAILCGIVGLATGSSWTASGTVGVALMGIAVGLGINPAIAAGMVISGAYMGDKWSPLSDSTNVAAATAETPLYEHVRAMMTTTLPSFLIALVLYTIVGLRIGTSGYDAGAVQEIQSTISAHFNVSPWVILPIIAIIIGAIKQIPAIPSLLFATFLGGIVAIVAQGAGVGDFLTSMHYGFSIETGHAVTDQLLNRGGLDSMLWTISLIMFALAFGGILEKCGFIEVLLGDVVSRVKSVGSLVTLTIVTGILSNVVLTDQYLAIIVPGRMYAGTYDKFGLKRSFLSRTLEDGGTLWSPMIPWNGCGAYQAATLGVHNFAFAPYAFMNLINPVYAIIISYLGIGVRYRDDHDKTAVVVDDAVV
ncbi:MAG TPA: Na+/H+ antiporter NhaC [Tissierellia bacterium]|nr:Na+/H+ antiporter NhaC [Tissierellia bacterium]